ncbi:MAG TPA: selenocysteine-specific translation elongation factor [Caldisericia bacterium]|nr:selenocysteine-specific translation elongation factor [Caldisericia bacterium]HOR46305.1 selenocysteine-specific translation elongation factor [Caldisericia bacterium]HOU08004.1 selenocysteine-specific translation elongation factor [Caldisericia bacterium]HPL89337.1 selenocysteine-specific translation elongation factor [Caldisericia bacterium]HQG58906.1 selenocysteine-specific translation elongation factor [Caldisericia bacterium]
MTKRSFIVGTAGHVDHGKSTLVTRLTGTDPDRLPEEKARQMTIELGFAKLDLPSGRMCGIVDVPGHEKLVKQMLMGAQGFDLVMFTVACDEGPKRQTYEHLSILDMIGIRVGVIVLTKCDLPHDDAVLQSQLDSMLTNTSLEAMPRIKVSAYTGEGIDELRQTIDDLLDHAIPRPLNMPAFYPVDRVFTVKGFGIVTTGTLWQGQVKKGEELEIFPSRKKGKLRGIESFDAQIETGDAGSRLALNFQNLDKEDISRGNILATPGRFDPTTEFDAKIRLIEKVKRRTRLKFHYATIEQEVDYSDIGGGFARIKLEGPLPLTKGSRFILRSIAPADTVGGGEVVDLHPEGKLNAPETLQRLENIGQIDDESYLSTMVFERRKSGFEVSRLRGLVNWPDDRFALFLKNGPHKTISGNLYDNNVFDSSSAKLSKLLTDFFKSNPSRNSISKSEAKAKLMPEINENLFSEILLTAIKEPLHMIGQDISLSNQTIQKSQTEVGIERELLREMFSPPTLSELRKIPAFSRNLRETEAAISKMIAEKIIIKSVDDLFFHKKAVVKAYLIMKALIEKDGSAKLAQYRDEVGTTRKYAQAMLELLDALGLTRRVGETRVLGYKTLDIGGK